MKFAQVLIGVICLAVSSFANDIDTLFARTKEIYKSDVSRDSVEHLVSFQKNDGSWKGPVYGKKGHMPIEHLANVRAMAYGFDQNCSGNLDNSKFCSDVKQSVIRALTFWFAHQDDFVSDNWWMNEIGVQRELSPISFMMWNVIPQSLRQKIIEYYPREPSGNGTNRAWISENVLVRGILERDENLIHLGTRNIESTMLVTKQEGHQMDHSFFMHGNQLYNGCYGKSALSLAARWASIVRETDYSFSNESMNSMALLALEGNRWMMWMGMVDAMTVGREIALKTDNKESFDFRDIIENLASVDTMHKFSYETWRQDISGQESQSGCRYFWRGEMMVCKSQDFYVSLKMSSSRTVGSEFLNRENRKGLWLGMGVLSVYRHPDDYKDIYPLWNWSMLPGVTSYEENEMKDKRVTNQSGFVGGMSDEKFGVAAMELDRPKLSAKKSWFFLDNKVIALGTDVASSRSSKIVTTLDQRLVHSNIFSEKGLLSNDEDQVRKLWHDGISYEMLDGKMMKARVEKRNGSWKDIGTQKLTEEGTVLSLWIDHGVNPSKSSYGYLIELNFSEPSFSAVDSRRFSIVRNDASAQVVYDFENRILAGTLFKPDRVDVKTFSMKFSEPTVFMLLRKNEKCLLKLIDPEKKSRRISVYIKRSKDIAEDRFDVNFQNSDFENPIKEISLPCPTGF